MKRLLLAWMLVACYADIYAQACCCSSASGNYSILPNLDKHVVGVRYTYSDFNTTSYPSMTMTMPNGDVMKMAGNAQPTMERMNTIDVFGRFILPKRFNLSVFLPVHVLSEKTGSDIQRSAGLGDASLLLQYAVFDPYKCNGKKSKHQLKLSAGVKAPTGKFSMTPDGMFSTDLQMGTGSVDFLFNAVYTYRYQKFGFNLLSTYKKNLVNGQGFRFGDKLREGLNLFYVFSPSKQVTITPNAGISYDHNFYNLYHAQKLTYTGGDYLTASAGLDVYYKQFALSTSVSPVLMSILNWQGEPVQRFTFEIGFYYSFDTNIIKHKNKSK